MTSLRAAVFLCLILGSASIHGAKVHSVNNNHSDLLLIILQQKIKIQSLQRLYPDLDRNQQKQNLDKQAHYIKNAMEELQAYVAIPESRYPNMDMYHKSLINRGALLQEFSRLLTKFQYQSN